VDPETQVLLQLQGAADGTHLGQFSSFELTRVQIALGLLTRQARENDYNRGTLGWIPNIPKAKSQGQRSFLDSGHADSTHFCAQHSHDKGPIGVEGNTHPSQDLHAMIRHVLKGLVDGQKVDCLVANLFCLRLHCRYTQVKRVPFYCVHETFLTALLYHLKGSFWTFYWSLHLVKRLLDSGLPVRSAIAHLHASLATRQVADVIIKHPLV